MGLRNFRGGVEKFSGEGLRNFRGGRVENFFFWGGVEKFQGGGVLLFRGGGNFLR